jgi:regulator of sirC expression with transglutaminase-like and TPR domain
MTHSELKALISLLDDEDEEVLTLVEQEIRQQRQNIIPLLEDRWSDAAINPIFQRRLEDLIHDLQFEKVLENLTAWKRNGGTDLLEGLWILATYQYPDLSLETLRCDFDQFYFEAWIEVKPDMHPIDQIRTLNHVFYHKLKFASNTKSFHSASNSMINVVIESRKGNPISLCCVYMLIAQRLKIPIYGVNLPNLFVMTYKRDSVQFYINAFNKGLVFMKSDIDHYVTQLGLQVNNNFYEPCTNLDIIRRMVRNLIIAFEKAGEPQKVQEIEQLSLLLKEDFF